MRIDGPDGTIGFLIADVSRMLRRVYDRRVRPLGLTRSQWQVLVHLDRMEGASQSELAAVLEIEKATLGRFIAALERKGWVERRVDERDLRARRLYIAPALRPLLDEMWALARSVRADALAGVEPAEIERLADTLGSIKANLTEILADPRPASKALRRTGS